MKLLFRQQPSFIFRFYVTNQKNELFYIIKRKKTRGKGRYEKN